MRVDQLTFVVSHLSRKNKDAAKLGHPADFVASHPCDKKVARMGHGISLPSRSFPVPRPFAHFAKGRESTTVPGPRTVAHRR
jgi:hypothetical protein